MQVTGEFGSKNVKLATRPDPVAGPGELVLEMRAVSINPRDHVVVTGGYGRLTKSLPLVPLCDGAGVVADIGSGVTGFKMGDIVITHCEQRLGRKHTTFGHGQPIT